MDISPTITNHTVVICVDKRERGIGMQALLTKAGYRVIVAVTLYDALKYIAQEMPHLVYSEALLSDGTAATLYDRLMQHETLKKTPILVGVLRKTKEELTPLAGRKFAAFYLGALDPATFLAKVREVMAAHSRVSPYFVPADTIQVERELTIAIEASVVGRSGEQIVSRSAAEVDPAASLLCVPSNPEFGPAVLRMASNLREGEEVFNLFPISRIVGAGRKWVLNLPEIKVGEKAQGEEKMNRVIFYEPNEARYEGFREILRGYKIDLIHAKSLAGAAAILKRDPAQIDAVYLHELMNDGSGIEWKNVYGKLGPSQRPPLIVGTTSMNARSTAAVRYIKRPFGMGLFVEMLQASFEKSGEVAAAAGKNAPHALAGVPVRFQAQANLVGLDETGGILEVRFPLLKGSRLIVTHKFLTQAWDGNAVVHVTGSAAMPSRPDVWHARFEVVTAGMSKVKYWERIAKVLQGVAAAPKATATLPVTPTAAPAAAVAAPQTQAAPAAPVVTPKAS
jgi:DNA-binding response OmpR family regulator